MNKLLTDEEAIKGIINVEPGIGVPKRLIARLKMEGIYLVDVNVEAPVDPTPGEWLVLDRVSASIIVVTDEAIHRDDGTVGYHIITIADNLSFADARHICDLHNTYIVK